MANPYHRGDRGGEDDEWMRNRPRRPRPVTDYGSSLVTYMSKRKPPYKGAFHYEQVRPSASYVVDELPPVARLDSPAESVPVRHLHTSLGKSKKPVTIVRWTAEGRRLLTGVHNGEFMLWNGMSFNFETVTAMGSSSLRAAEWSPNRDWLIASNDEGTVYYLQPTLNNPHQFKAHDSPIRDLSFSPSGTKFVTASDDGTCKIFDFTSSQNESTFNEHGWDVKAVDWHPSKSLIASGSKDHSVKLWDPRTTRNLTTLHGHKNAITAVTFSSLRDSLLATAGRDSLARVFDLRMMKDVSILRGHEKGITALTWHPIHASLLSTGGDDGSLNSYLLDEANTPAGISTANISPYYSPDPSTSPAQSIYPAHRIPYAHESSIWSMDWHPLGHILATGSNDHYTRFWSRSLPGQTDCFKDQFHLGEEGAEAQGTWDRKFGRKQAREQEEQEAEDEAEGLEDQKPTFGMIPGLPLPGQAPPSLIPGMGTLPPAPTSFNGNGSRPPVQIPNVDSALLAKLFQNGALPPGIGGQHGHQPPFPILLPSQGQFLNNLPPPPPPGSHPIDFSKLGQLPPGFPLPPPPGQNGFLQGGIPGLPGLGADVNGGGADAAGIRRRAPLPSQQESLKQEQAQGRFRIAR